jgi:hypothetical protein
VVRVRRLAARLQQRVERGEVELLVVLARRFLARLARGLRRVRCADSLGRAVGREASRHCQRARHEQRKRRERQRVASRPHRAGDFARTLRARSA